MIKKTIKIISIIIAWVIFALLVMYFIAWFAGYDYDTGESTTKSIPEILRSIF